MNTLGERDEVGARRLRRLPGSRAPSAALPAMVAHRGVELRQRQSKRSGHRPSQKVAGRLSRLRAGGKDRAEKSVAGQMGGGLIGARTGERVGERQT